MKKNYKTFLRKVEHTTFGLIAIELINLMNFFPGLNFYSTFFTLDQINLEMIIWNPIYESRNLGEITGNKKVLL